jgi:transposase
MKEKTFLRAEEVANELDVSLAYAYKLIRRLNAELQGQGFITINRRISKKYFAEKLYGQKAGQGGG